MSTRDWDSYRSCNCAKELRDFFESVAPGSVQSSESEHILLQGNISYERKSLFEGYYEVRTYYFPADLSKERRVAFEAALKPPPGAIGRFLGVKLANAVGPTTWCWLKGLRSYEGQTTSALRIMFRWNSPQIEQHHEQELKEDRSHGRSDSRFQCRSNLIGLSPRALEDAGMLGSVSYHCRFVRGRP